MHGTNLGSVKARLLASAQTAAITLSALTFLPSGYAEAQQAAAPAETVTVTGSRIQTSGFETPTPVTQVTAQDLSNSAPLISEALNQLPNLSVGSQRTGGIGTGGSGQAIVTVRGLGATRTLVLLDGRRYTPTAAAGTVDTSQIPNALVSRVDIVTGGASAAYGSDAVAGVVNYILDTKLVGIKGGMEGGISARGDVPEWQANLAGGVGWGPGDRGHFLFSVEGYASEGIERKDRAFSSAGYARITNPCPIGAAVSTTCPTGSNGLTQNLRVADANITTASVGGLIISGPLIGTTFDANGTPRPFQYGTLVTNAGTMMGGETNRGSLGLGTSIIGSLARANMFTRTSYDITDDFKVFLEANYALSINKNSSGYPFAVGNANSFKITQDNAYLPASIKAAMIANKLTTIPVGRLFSEFPDRPPITDDSTYRLLAGTDFDVWGWKVEAYYQRGFNKRRQSQPNQMDQIKMYQAADAVIVPAGTKGLVAGEIACRSTLTNPSDGCIPLNIFGVGAPSPQVIHWLTSTNNGQGPVNNLTYTQDVASISASGTLFDLWGQGPIRAAIGGEYRKEDLIFVSDPYSQVANPISGGFGGWLAGSQLPYTGAINVKEGFAEIDIPIAHDMTLVQDASLNGAIRVTDYSLSGNVTTWKLGALYNPIDSLRFRYTRSRDIRAPTLAQFFQAGGSGTGNLVDEAPGRVGLVAAGVKLLSSGNTSLVPEVANTEVYGLVYTPDFIEGLQMSWDHYSINIANAITSIGNQTYIDGCYGNGIAVNLTFCSHIIRNPVTGDITAVQTSTVNAQSLINSGYDAEVSYQNMIPGWVPLFDDWNFRFRELLSYINHDISTAPGGAPQDSAPTDPRWRSLSTITLGKDNFTSVVQLRAYPSRPYSLTLVQGAAGSLGINDNHVAGLFYVDTKLSYRFEWAGGAWESYFSVNNLFDHDPPIAPGTISSEAGFTIGDADVEGRSFRVGINFRY